MDSGRARPGRRPAAHGESARERVRGELVGRGWWLLRCCTAARRCQSGTRACNRYVCGQTSETRRLARCSGAAQRHGHGLGRRAARARREWTPGQGAFPSEDRGGRRHWRRRMSLTPALPWERACHCALVRLSRLRPGATAACTGPGQPWVQRAVGDADMRTGRRWRA